MPATLEPFIASAPVRSADVRKADELRIRRAIGKAINRARELRGWSLKELADHVDRDERQVARWMTGEDRPQFDALLADVSLQQPLLQAFAERLVGHGVEVTTSITVRRTT